MSTARIAPRAVAIVLAVALLTGAGLAGSLAPRRVYAQATAPSVSAAVDDTLMGMLGRLPDRPLGLDGAMVTYADIARQTETLELDLSQNASEEANQQHWLEAVMPLSLPQATARYWTLPEWREAFGFDLFQVEQAVEYSAPPFGLTVLRGAFDPEELRAAWARGGYQPIDLGAGEAYAVREDYEIDVIDPVGQMALGYLNVVALAGDGTLIFGSTRDGVRSALATIGDTAPSFVDRADVAPLVYGAPPDLASAVLMDGELLRAVPDPVTAVFEEESLEDFATRAAEEQVEARRLPPVAAALLGQTAGIMSSGDETATPGSTTAVRAKLVVVLSTISSEAAKTAATVITERLATQRRTSPFMNGEVVNRPWAELFPIHEVHAVVGEPAVLIMLVPAPGVSPFILQEMLFQRTPGFLAWEW